jgi:putative nucleotidyltransferase with HDIG domain
MAEMLHLTSMETTVRQTPMAQVVQITSLLGEHDAGTLRHSWRVSRLAGEMALQLGAPAAVCQTASLAGLLHDVGKLAVPTALINKPGALTEGEARIMEGHTLSGARMVRSFAPPEIVHVVAHHHDRLDEWPSLPWLTRLVSVADAYDALVSDRPYRAGCSPATAVQELHRVAGAQLDSDLVDVLLSALGAPLRLTAAA